MNESPQQTGAEFSKLSFVVIDDFENFRVSMREMLRSCGADKIESFAQAAPAIQYCAYNHVDVVLCDYNLGEGKNGQHILEELRHKKLLKHASLFLMVTAETSKEMVMGAREYQPDGYLTKPINRAVLNSRLSALIHQRKALLPINREIDRENYPEAISLCLKALPTQPRYKTWLTKTLADLYYKVGDFSHALKIYEEVLGQRELSWARLGRGRILTSNGDYDQAVEALSELIQKHPDYMEAYDLLAVALEKQGKPAQAQQILEKAAKHSPNALLRQKQLANLATSNQDLATASEAWRKTVTLGTHSIHDSSEHYLALGQTLCDLSEDDTSNEGQAHAAEALTMLRRMERRFASEEDVKVRSRVVQSRVHMGQGNIAEAEKTIDSVAEELAAADTMSPDIVIDYSKTLFRLGRDDEAKRLLGELAQRCSDDPALIQKIENLLDEPVGFQQKLKARALNREGIKAFESGRLDEAVDIFKQALEIVPSHAALNLNLAQVLLKQHQASNNPQLLHQAQTFINRLDSLPEQHRQSRRLASLRNKLEGLIA